MCQIAVVGFKKFNVPSKKANYLIQSALKSELLNIKRGTLMWGSPNGASDIGLIENVSL